jgi:hypothetical protein
MYSKRTIIGKLLPTNKTIEKLELYAENKDGEMVLLGEIEGEESLKTVLNLIKI